MAAKHGLAPPLFRPAALQMRWHGAGRENDVAGGPRGGNAGPAAPDPSGFAVARPDGVAPGSGLPSWACRLASPPPHLPRPYAGSARLHRAPWASSRSNVSNACGWRPAMAKRPTIMQGRLATVHAGRSHKVANPALGTWMAYGYVWLGRLDGRFLHKYRTVPMYTNITLGKGIQHVSKCDRCWVCSGFSLGLPRKLGPRARAWAISWRLSRKPHPGLYIPLKQVFTTFTCVTFLHVISCVRLTSTLRCALEIVFAACCMENCHIEGPGLQSSRIP